MERRLREWEQVEHICRNRRCVWWDLHLGAVSQEENMARQALARRHLRQPALFPTSPYENELRALGLYPPLR
jgi:hypothetical protein